MFSPDTKCAGALSLDLQTPELQETKFCCLHAALSMSLLLWQSKLDETAAMEENKAGQEDKVCLALNWLASQGLTEKGAI